MRKEFLPSPQNTLAIVWCGNKNEFGLFHHLVWRSFNWSIKASMYSMLLTLVYEILYVGAFIVIDKLRTYCICLGTAHPPVKVQGHFRNPAEHNGSPVCLYADFSKPNQNGICSNS